MNKWQQFIQNLKNPPIERLARVEYQSHFLNIAGVLVVALILILKGYWYIILAFVFSLGVSYSQGMAAYSKYQMIREALDLNKPKTKEQIIWDIEQEISPMRRRRKIMNLVGTKYLGWFIMLLSVLASVAIINPFGNTIWMQIAFTSLILPIYLLLYFFVIFYPINWIYRRKHGKTVPEPTTA